MRITQDTLLRIAQDTVDRRARAERNLVAAYLCGSLLGEDYLLGGAADIDLVLIHIDTPSQEREIVSLTDEVHLDIAHHGQKLYRQARQLRPHPWVGPTLSTCKMLYDPQHFLDFTQASVRGQFDRSDYVLQRSRQQADQARRIWLCYQTEPPAPGPQSVFGYLRAVGQAANAIASLNGPPLTERRLLLGFPERAAAVDRPGLYAGLLGLLGAAYLEPDSLSAWLPGWRAAYCAIPAEKAPARLHPSRRLYYQRAFEAILVGPAPQAVLWPLLRTWTLAILQLPLDSAEWQAWQRAFEFLGLLDVASSDRLDALDAYLDQVEETLEDWARQNGAEYA
ncbi:MAG: hypothetical protein AB1894_01605 [Chloroflexota bacterium]